VFTPSYVRDRATSFPPDLVQPVLRGRPFHSVRRIRTAARRKFGNTRLI